MIFDSCDDPVVAALISNVNTSIQPGEGVWERYINPDHRPHF